LSIPKASVSQLRLKLPDGWTLESDHGFTSFAPGGSIDGWTEWIVNLGSDTTCVLKVKQSAKRFRPAVLYSMDSTYSIRPGELSVRFDVVPEVYNSAIRECHFSITKELEIQSVTMSDVTLEWKVDANEQRSRKLINVSLPDGILGKSETIRIQGVAALQHDKSATLPVSTMLNAGFRTGSLELSIDQPLKLRSMRSRGLLQTETFFDSAERHHLTYLQYLPNHELKIDAGDPQSVIAARSLSGIAIKNGKCTLAADVQWQCKTGSVFNLRCKIPDGWQVTDIQMRAAAESSTLAGWSLQTSGDATYAQMQLRDPVRPGSTKALRIIAERELNAGQREFTIQNIRPVDCADIDVFTAVLAPANSTLTLESASGIKRFTLDGLSEEWGTDELDELLGTSDGSEQLRLYRSSQVIGANNINVTLRESPNTIDSKPEPPSPASLDNDTSTPESKLGSTMPAVTAELDSTLTTAEQGFDFHRIRYQVVGKSNLSDFQLTLPTELTVISIIVNDSDVHPGAEEYLSASNSPRTIRVSAAEGTVRSVDIKFHLPANATLFYRHVGLVLPTVPYPTINATWRIATAPDFEIRGNGNLSFGQEATNLSWRERLFGPIGRRSNQAMFNPFRLRNWQPDFSKKAVASVKGLSSKAAFAPAGWTVHTSNTTSFPDFINADVWNRRNVMTLSWIALTVGLLGTCIWRALTTTRANQLSAFAMMVFAILAMTLPELIAPVAGGCFSGVLFATLIPLSLVVPRWTKASNPSVLSMPSTVTFQQASDSLRLLFLAIGLSAFTMSSTTSDQLQAQERPAKSKFDVLIPVGEDLKLNRLVPLVYVDQELFDRWQAMPDNNVRADYVITSAKYEGSLQSATDNMTGTFEILSLEPESNTTVQIDIDSKNVGGPNACLVDGKPTAILPSSNGKGFVIQLPKKVTNADDRLTAESRQVPAKYEVVLNLHPTSTSNEALDSWTMAIPAVANSQLSVESINHDDRIVCRSAIGKTQSDKGTLAVQIGNASEIILHRITNQQQTVPNVTVSVAKMVEIHPTLITFQNQLRYNIASGSVSSLQMKLEPDLIVKSVTAADADVDYYTTSINGEPHLQIEFDDDRTGELDIDIELTRVVRNAAGPQAVPSAFTLDEVESYAIVVSGRDLIPLSTISSASMALRTSSAFLITPELPSTNDYTEITVSNFLDTWQTQGSARPDFAYNIDTASLNDIPPLNLQVSPILPTKIVERLEQSAKISAYRIDWSCNIEVMTTDAPAFVHQLLIDPRMTIDSMSVLETDAERLAHYSRAGFHTQLYLKARNIYLGDQNAGIQNVIIKGHVPLNPDGLTPLPIIGIQNARINNNSLRVLATPEVSVRLQVVDQFANAESTTSSDLTNTQQVIGQFEVPDRLLSRDWFRDRVAKSPNDASVDSDGARPSVRVELRNRTARVRSWTSLEMAGENLARLHNDITIETEGRQTKPFRIQVPASLLNNFGVSHPDIVLSESNADGGLTVTISPTAVLPTTIRVAAEANIKYPLTGMWQLPVIRIEDASVQESLLITPNDFEYQPATYLELDNVPTWAESSQSKDIRDARIMWNSDGDWRLQRSVRSTDVESAEPLLLQHVLTQDSAQVSGKSTLHIASSTNDEFKIRIPQGVALNSLFVNRQSVQLTSTALQTVVLDTSESLNRLDLYWTALNSYFDGGSSVTFTDLPIRNVYTVLEIPEDFMVVRQTGWSPQSIAETRINHTEQLIELVRSSLDRNLDVQFVWGQLASSVQSLRRIRFESLSKESNVRISDLIRRFQELQETVGSTNAEQTAADAPSKFDIRRNRFALRTAKTPKVPFVAKADFVSIFIGAAILLIAIICFARLRRHWHHQSIVYRPYLSLCSMGLIWWAFMAPPVLGMLWLLAVALIYAQQTSRAAQTEKIKVLH